MKLVMLQGLPASGKSTYAAEVCKEQNWKRVNRDLIRTMIHFDQWSGKNESITVDLEKAIAWGFLKEGLNVVVDDCNLNPKNKEMWKEVAKDAEAEFSTKLFNTPFEECIERDEVREKKAGAHVIKNMAFQYSTSGIPMKKIVICDIDGTVADTTHRLHYLESTQEELDSGKTFMKDWKGFFSQMVNDPVREDIRTMLWELDKSEHHIVFVSGRPDTYREFTQNWLIKNGLNFEAPLLMRKAKDSRADTIIKSEIYDTYFADKEVVKVIDDRPSVIRMWRERGLDVLDCGKGVEF